MSEKQRYVVIAAAEHHRYAAGDIVVHSGGREPGYISGLCECIEGSKPGLLQWMQDAELASNPVAQQESPRFYAATPPVRSGLYKVQRSLAAWPVELLYYDVKSRKWRYGDAVDTGPDAGAFPTDEWWGLLAPCHVE